MINTNTSIISIGNSYSFLRRAVNQGTRNYEYRIKTCGYIPYFVCNEGLISWRRACPNGYQERISDINYDNPLYILIANGIMKSTSDLFYNVFKWAGFLKGYQNKENLYYISKGAIFTDDFKPLLIVMCNYDKVIKDMKSNNVFAKKNGETYLNYPSDLYTNINKKESLDLFISRKIFYNEFKFNNKKICSEIHNEILPELLKLNLRTHIREDLDIFYRVKVNTSYNNSQMQSFMKSIFKEEVEYYSKIF